MTSPFKPPSPHDSQDRSRMIVAVALSLAILFGFSHFYDKPRQEAARAAMEKQAADTQAKMDIAATTGAAPVGADKGAPLERAAALADGERLPIKGDKVTGTLSLKGLRLDDLTLNEHKETLNSDDPVVLLAPGSTAHGFWFENGWIAGAGAIGPMPSADTVWKVAAGSPREIVSGGQPVVLQWDNGQGLTFEREIALDDKYLFTITSRVKNHGAHEAKLNTYQLVARNNLPRDFSGFFVLHEGPIGSLDGKQEDLSYKKMRKGDSDEKKDVSGWLGITDKYWLVAMLPQPEDKFNARVVAAQRDGNPNENIYQTDLVSKPLTVAPGAEASQQVHLFAGVKNVPILNSYQDALKVNHLDYAMDFGMWYFITKPFYFLLHALFALTGSVAAGILLMTVIVRGAVFPLASKAFRSMAKMKKVQPRLKELQEQYKNDRAGLQVAIFELYKKEQVNPFSGCWPMLVQIPIFFALYKVILLSVDLRHAPFWGWIHDLSAPDPTSIFNLFGLIPWTPPQALMIGAWPVLFCLSMVLQKRLTPPMPDPVQERLQSAFPFIFTVMLAHFASGLVIYWTWSNTLSILQQYYILRKVGGENVSLLRGHHERRRKKSA